MLYRYTSAYNTYSKKNRRYVEFRLSLLAIIEHAFIDRKFFLIVFMNWVWNRFYIFDGKFVFEHCSPGNKISITQNHKSEELDRKHNNLRGGFN